MNNKKPETQMIVQNSDDVNVIKDKISVQNILVSTLTTSNQALVIWVVIVTLALTVLAAVSFKRWRKERSANSSASSTGSSYSPSINSDCNSDVGSDLAGGEANQAFEDESAAVQIDGTAASESSRL